MDHRARDDQMLINKAVYIPSPSPAPPPDGSYYNMNSDRYLSYPPMVSSNSSNNTIHCSCIQYNEILFNFI